MPTINVELTEEQVRKFQELSAEQLEAAGVSGGDGALGVALSLFGGWAFGRAMDSIANANPDISGRQVSEIVAA
jgi:hypothetical protein